MEVIYILLGFSLLIALIFLVAFVINVKSGQYDDTYSPGVRILFDDLKKKKTGGKDSKETDKLKIKK